ncbi:MAG: type II and III secretion system protein family protein [Alphaproteobacteria bacterium]
MSRSKASRSPLGLIARSTAIAVLTAALAIPVPLIPVAQAQGVSAVSRGAAQGNLRMNVGVGKSVGIDLPRDARDVIVANPAIANAVVRSARRAFVIGVAVGQTNIFFLDGDGRQIAGYDIEVGRDLGGLRAALRSVLPAANLDVSAVNDSVVVSGQVMSALEAQQAVDMAIRLVGDEKKVVNAIGIRGKDQVHLKVTVAEVQRNTIKQLGINLNAFTSGSTLAVPGVGTASALSTATGMVVGLLSGGRFNVNGTEPTSSGTVGTTIGGNTVTSTLRALQENGIVRTLAEPTLTAISGEQAKFLAGGEFPVPSGRDTQGNILLEFKPFGVGLGFTPVVLSEDRISLRVGTEVSEISNDVTVRLQGLTVPGLRIRRADTTVELPSGGSIVIAGLLQEQTRQAVSGVPGLMNVPVLGALFRSRDFLRGQTELVVIVTPYIVKPVPANRLQRPDDGYADASDPATFLLGRLNRLYGSNQSTMPTGRLNGSVGFIRD